MTTFLFLTRTAAKLSGRESGQEVSGRRPSGPPGHIVRILLNLTSTFQPSLAIIGIYARNIHIVAWVASVTLISRIWYKAASLAAAQVFVAAFGVATAFIASLPVKDTQNVLQPKRQKLFGQCQGVVSFCASSFCLVGRITSGVLVQRYGVMGAWNLGDSLLRRVRHLAGFQPLDEGRQKNSMRCHRGMRAKTMRKISAVEQGHQQHQCVSRLSSLVYAVSGFAIQEQRKLLNRASGTG